MSINSIFDKLGFHHQGIFEIIRNCCDINLKLENIFLSGEYDQLSGVNELLSNCILYIRSIEGEKAVYWDDNK